MRTLGVLMFIAAVAAGAIYLARRPTIARGEVMATDLLGLYEGKGVTSLACDPEIPVGAAGAVFHCRLAASDGSTARIEYTMDREGMISAQVVGPGAPASPSLATDDPWGN